MTNATFDDELQAYAAGVAEGIATRDLIQKHWQNTVSGYCNGVASYCERLQAYLEANLKWTLKLIASHPNDPYWRQVRRFIVVYSKIKYFIILKNTI